ncbi:MAG: carboxylesterase family protein [Acidimicrobiales bacterium]
MPHDRFEFRGDQMTTTTRIRQGELRGSEHHGVVRFAGIPFTAPVTGARRFRPPEPHDGWSGVRGATAMGPIAPQQDLLASMMGADPEPQDEDCLFLNVYTPAVDDAHRPVMVWIHGGAFIMGSGSQVGYDGASLARRGDVVVVTVNYRLGALGFLHLAELDPSYDRSGNLGILDQIAALEWVRDNIAAFGGDPGNVTVFGESAGGMSVGTLLGTPAARGLFHKAVPQSGAAQNVSPVAHAAEVTRQLLEAAGVEDLDGLLALDADALVAAQQQLALKTFTDVDGQIGAGARLLLPFQPVADGVVLEGAAIDAVAAGSAAGVPVLVGTCLDEWKLFAFLDPAPVDDALLETRLGKVFGDGAAAAAVYGARRPAPEGALRGGGHGSRVPPAGDPVVEALVANGSPTFSYLFTWPNPTMGGLMGACHAIEGAVRVRQPRRRRSVDAARRRSARLRRRRRAGLVAGVRPHRGPVERRRRRLAGVRHRPRATMRLDVHTEVLDDPEHERRQLWAGLT